MPLLCVSNNEEGSMAVLEAMVQGTPFIGTRVGGVSELIEHERNGLLHPLGDAGQLAACIQRMLDNPRERESFATQARMDFETRFSPAALAARVDKVYRALLPNREVPAPEA